MIRSLWDVRRVEERLPPGKTLGCLAAMPLPNRNQPEPLLLLELDPGSLAREAGWQRAGDPA
ncbi:MAG: hypothetical protein LBI49_04230 [Nocardiopsaceae bacterium]|nr:hypothetical protein [Nocardiopsaceae bacterium]